MNCAFWFFCLTEHSVPEMLPGSAQAPIPTYADMIVNSGLSFSYHAQFQCNWIPFLKKKKKKNTKQIKFEQSGFDLTVLTTGHLPVIATVCLEPSSHLGSYCQAGDCGSKLTSRPVKQRGKQWWYMAVCRERIFSSVLISGYTDDRLGIKCNHLQL